MLRLIKNNKLNHLIAITLLSIYPIFFFIGSAALNTLILILNIFFIYEIISKKKFSFLNNLSFYSLLALWLFFLINLIFFSINIDNSFGRSFGFLRFILFTMLIIYYLNINNQKYINIVFNSWSIIFIIVTVDLIYEIIVGSNILGFKSYMPGRLSGFYNDELKIGHFYYAFILIISSHLINKFFINNKFYLIKEKFKNQILFITIMIFILIAFMIGERSNFIKIILMFLFLSFFLPKRLFKYYLSILCLIFFIVVVIINSNQGYKTRFVNQFFKPLIKNPILFIKNTSYGRHYDAALQVYKNNKFFGVGLKNYRVEVANQKYYEEPSESEKNPKIFDSSIHPHQIHFEILTELGIIGYSIFFLIFILNIYKFFKEKLNYNKIDYIQLSGFLFVITSLLPLLPSGSFFTTQGATLFWMNFALMKIKK